MPRQKTEGTPSNLCVVGDSTQKASNLRGFLETQSHLQCAERVLVVRMVGLEPTRLAASEPKSGASTNFATSAEKEREFYLKENIPASIRRDYFSSRLS